MKKDQKNIHYTNIIKLIKDIMDHDIIHTKESLYLSAKLINYV